MINAVAYVRMSSDRQEASPKQQREAIEQMAEGKYRIVRWYQDDGISGAEAEKREAFQRLITDATERGDFQAVLCWDQDRFSRFDPIEANYYWHILSKAGVKLVTVSQGELDFADLGGWLTASVTQYGKAQFLRDLSRNVVRGRLSRAKQGRYTGSRAPYGYNLNDGQLILGDLEKVEAVRWIFQQYTATDTSLQDLAEQLNKRRIESPTGKPWQRGTLQAILHRTAYLGRAPQLCEEKGKFYTVRNGSVAPKGDGKKKPVADWFYVECPQIIDQELFDRAQERMAARRREPTSKARTRVGILRGLLFCSHCGAKMVAAANGKLAKEQERFYQCSTYNSRGKHGCCRNLFRESTAIELLIPRIQETALSPANFDRLAKAVRRQIASRKRQAPANVAKLRAKLASIEADLKAAGRELKRVPDDLYDVAVAEYRGLQAEQQRAEAALEAAQDTPGGLVDNIDALVDRALAGLHTLQQKLKSADGRVARGALQAIVDRIDLEFEHTRGTKQVRSHFSRGTVRFKTSNLVSSVWFEFAELPDVGETLARRIVESRATAGPFKDQSDLRRVRGIGPLTLEKMKPYLMPLPDQEDVAGGAKGSQNAL